MDRITSDLTGHRTEELLCEMLNTELYKEEFPRYTDRVFHRWCEDIFDRNHLSDLMICFHYWNDDLEIYINAYLTELLYQHSEYVDIFEYTYGDELTAIDMLNLLQEYCGEYGYDWMENKDAGEINNTILYWVKIEAVRDEVKDWAEEISKYYYRDYQKVIKKLWDSYKLRKRMALSVTLKKSLVHTQTKNILSYLYK